VELHTRILVAARNWQTRLKLRRDLLIGDERQNAVAWLEKRFENESLPTSPTDLQCEYICESTVNANNLLTQVFIGYAPPDHEFAFSLRQILLREHITVLWDTHAPEVLAEYYRAEMLEDIENADNFIYLLSPHSRQSKVCDEQLKHALALHKRVLALVIAPTSTLSVTAHSVPIIDFTVDKNNASQELLRTLHEDAYYHEQHKILLVKVLKWEQQHHNHSLLLRGHNLEHFEAWLKDAKTRQTYLPLENRHEAFISESRQHEQYAEIALEVFISYSQSDSDFARKLNTRLQSQGKMTWFDQETIAVGVDFQEEIHRGIEESDNFLFIISPKSIHSKYCADEVEYAQQLGKRIITVLHREVVVDELHPVLQDIQWLDFTVIKKFETNFNELVRALDIDREHVRQHRKLTQRALEWNRENQSADLLLRGNEFAIAAQWLQDAKEQKKKPASTPLQQELIGASRRTIVTAEQKFELEVNQRVEERTAELKTKLSAAQLVNSNLQTLLYVGGGLALLVVVGLGGWHAFRQPECEKSVECEAVTQSEPKKIKPVPKYTKKDWKIFRDTLADGSKGPEMIWIPAGTFIMGDIQGSKEADEGPVHEVSVARVAMGRYEVTVGEFRQFVKATEYKTDAESREGCGKWKWEEKEKKWNFEYVKNTDWRSLPDFSQEDDHPVVCVSWNDATAYTKWLSEKTGHEYRLPTEVEWEYAARAQTITARYWGNNPDDACHYANVADKTAKETFPNFGIHNCTDGYTYTAPVGQFKFNTFGLFDMLGNVWEWTCSEYENKYKGKELLCAENVNKNRRVLRGGSWLIDPVSARAADRNRFNPVVRYNGMGFRVVRRVART